MRLLESRPPRAPPRAVRVARARARTRRARRRSPSSGCVDPAELVGVGTDVDQRLPRVGDVEQRVARGLDLAQPRPDHQEHVGLAHALREPRVGTEREVPGVARRAVVDMSWQRQRRRDGEPARLGPGDQRRGPRRSTAPRRRSRAGAPRRRAASRIRVEVGRRRAGLRRLVGRGVRRRRPPRRACPRAARARPARGGRRWRRGTPGRRARGSGRRSSICATHFAIGPNIWR